MGVRDLQFAEGAAVQPKPQPRPARNDAGSRGGWAIRRASSWRRNGPQAVVVKKPIKLSSVALDAVAVALGLGVGLAVVAAISIVATF
jgi:hypothetical protein